MSTIRANANAERLAMSAIVTRADGTVEDLGTIAYYHSNPLRRLWWHLTGRAT